MPVIAVGALAGLTPLRALASPLTAGSTLIFGFTNSEQSFVVPAGATLMQVTVVGAAGGSTYPEGTPGDNAASGGHGAAVTADIPAPTVGSNLYVEVGGQQVVGGNATGQGGFNGGGDGGPGSGGGGGASDLRTVPSSAGASSLASRLVVAAGGGGAGSGGADVNSFCYRYGCPPGNGGSAQAGTSTGASGQAGPNIDGTADYHYGGYGFVQGGNGGGGATTGTGGAGATSPAPDPSCGYTEGGCTGDPGSAGTSGQGGDGSNAEASGGGGGGGYFGGGGGASGVGFTTYAVGGGGGGGAGSSFVEAGALNPTFAVASVGAEVIVTFNPTTVAASCTTNPESVNASTTCTATVSNVDSGDAVAATGTVSWSDAQNGSASPTSCTLSGATCSVSFTPAAGSEGVHHLTASYGGDSAHSASSTTTTVTAAKRSDTTGVACAPASTIVGVATSCTATVSDTSAGTAITPGGTMTWTSAAGTFSPTTCGLSAGACSTAFTPSAGHVGPETVNAAYGGDTDHLTSSGSTSIGVGRRTDSISADCGSSNITVYLPVTCTVSVTDTASGTTSAPTGTASWSIGTGSGQIGSACTFGASGDVGSCSVVFMATSGAEGSIVLDVTYSGDVDFPGASTTVDLAAGPRTDTTAITCGALETGVQATCTATVTDNDAGNPTTPTGSVDFSVGAGSGTFATSSCALGNTGACSVLYTPSVAGPRTMTAVYLGDVDHAISLRVIQVWSALRSVTVTAGCATSPLAIGPSDTCTVTVTDTDPGQTTTPTGTVSWNATPGPDALGASGTCTLDGSGQCSLSLSADPGATGTQTLDATYSGDSLHATTDGTTTVDVVPQLPTTDALTGTTPANVALTLAPTAPTGVGPFTYSLVTTPNVADGVATIDAATGAVTFTPATDFSGIVPTFLYAVTDRYNQQAQQNVNITVTPIAMPDAAAGIAGTTITANPPTPTGVGPFTYSLVGASVPSGDGIFSIDASTGVLFFTPTASFSGNVSVSYVVTDASGATSAPAVVRFSVQALAITVPTTGAGAGLLVSGGLAVLVVGLLLVGQALWFRPRRIRGV
ncbi:MAG TPA: Ig-like domain-containing protein [Candidatus Dormibacteraeota bacterium]